MNEFTNGFIGLFGQLKKDLITEAFSNFEYALPDDPEKMLYDFYFLTWAGSLETSDIKFNYAIKDAKDTIVESLTKHMLAAVKFSMLAEVLVYEYRR